MPRVLLLTPYEDFSLVLSPNSSRWPQSSLQSTCQFRKQRLPLVQWQTYRPLLPCHPSTPPYSTSSTFVVCRLSRMFANLRGNSIHTGEGLDGTGLVWAGQVLYLYLCGNHTSNDAGWRQPTLLVPVRYQG